ncbi:hypothetical protein A3A93_05135 [Candidatus Roizmanbacteria bacterium RIFCSPLOWO2_01_FULL_38_12]|uniref:Phosphodiester glycosidase domain-containing protein n=1 Tax=Candidatus Roizmanbacteria bacterium RIFCSPLOWO2_01_FULL_38_12 TaxID=1802061 RepID=A0A1F7IQZ4_9BACT|nr:MAG: hypothetical protein A2861_03240 [Candidatus Roizmanbacteria bacterium RIFCSPHIGHO2_01_FULL_38_15]OGK35988.1 MAG: hypothetical protein A3F59_05400 [Candidatus Roizmanbacteria bacterium RIFCSPHIGHO2_12_FULL_38_13]OGK45775.1 MAG: hypothetical protein A3A93_05135 [Candidatus Roizmanbacteria bacterium RIFCSPLOWO2_01_FULL_38_12]
MKIKSALSYFKPLHAPLKLLTFLFALVLVVSVVINISQKKENDKLALELAETKKTLDVHIEELTALKKEDQYVKNKQLEETIKNIEDTYKQSVGMYEKLLDLKGKTKEVEDLDTLFAQALTYLSERNYASGAATLKSIGAKILEKDQEIASTFSIPVNVVQSNAPPGAGYKRQTVKAEIGEYLVDIIAADLNSTRVIVDTASDGDCKNDCPVSSLADYASRSGAFAGINGPYFCPADYPSCADKKNSFDTLLMNKNKVYFNSDNNVYSSVPAIIFSGGSGRIVGQSLEWGRDTGVDSVIASQPMLLSGGNNVFGGDDEPKRGTKGSRSFVGSSGNMAYIGVVHNATVAEVAYVLKSLGLQSAINLDSGGSTALIYNGSYLIGPGRNTPFGILFVSK